MKFREIAPIPELQPIVEGIWTLESEPGEAGGQIEPVLPDGCPELVMQCGDCFERVFSGGACERRSTMLSAGHLTPRIALKATRAIATLGVRFRPGSAAAILHMPQQPLHGTMFGVDVLDRGLARDLAAIQDGSRSLRDAVD